MSNVRRRMHQHRPTTMPSSIRTSRRSVVKSTLLLPPALVLTGISGCQAAAPTDRQLLFSSLKDAEEDLNKLAAANELVSGAAWTWAQTLEHCAQSIEYSVSGIPESKSKLFQNTVGSAAFGVFSWRGRMTHDLAEPIPGSPSLALGTAPEVALARLRASMANFRNWSKPLQPHFAYGTLDKKAYEQAHAMHLANHLSQFRAAS
jgi:hypothetical protein